MEFIEIVTIILVVLFLSSVIIGNIIKRKKGKIGCSDCSNCTLKCNERNILYDKFRKDNPKVD